MRPTRLALSLLLALPAVATAGPGGAGPGPLVLARVLGGAPAEPVLVDRYAYLPTGRIITSIGNTGIGIWNILDPSLPVQFDTEPADTFATDIAVPFDNHALLVTRADQVLWLDLGNPVRPRLGSEVLVAGAVDAFDIGFIDDTALILQNSYGLQIADASTLEPRGRLEMDLPPVLQQRAFEEMAIDSSHAYLASWGGAGLGQPG